MEPLVPFAFGVSLLVVAVAIGLGHLAVHTSRIEHGIGLGVAWGVGVPLLLVSPAAGVLLVLTGAGTCLLLPAEVPDGVPPHWQEPLEPS
jgi:hypothetical protein